MVGCDLFYYGDGCVKNCFCNEIEVCDNVNGLCFLVSK